MQSGLYVIADTRAKKVSDPFSSPNDETAKRNALFGCFASATPPQDVLLWRVAEFETADCSVDDFGIVNTKVVLIPFTVEEINAFHTLYLSIADASDKELENVTIQ